MEVAQQLEGFTKVKNIVVRAINLTLIFLLTGCLTPLLERNKQSILDENNLDNKFLISTFCSYYVIPKNSSIRELPYMFSGLCGLDSQSGKFFFKSINESDGLKPDKKISFSEFKNFSQDKYNLGGAICDVIKFLCIPHEQMVLVTKTEKHIIEFRNKDSDNFAKVFRELKLKEVESDNIYLIYRPVVTPDLPIINYK